MDVDIARRANAKPVREGSQCLRGTDSFKDGVTSDQLRVAAKSQLWQRGVDCLRSGIPPSMDPTRAERCQRVLQRLRRAGYAQFLPDADWCQSATSHHTSRSDEFDDGNDLWRGSRDEL